VDVCSDILESFPPLPGMEGVELEMHEAPILLRYRCPPTRYLFHPFLLYLVSFTFDSVDEDPDHFDADLTMVFFLPSYL